MHFAVIMGQGEAWDHSKPMREQAGWPDHATFMNGLADSGFVVLGGPLGDGSTALLIVAAADEDTARSQLAQDPWAHLRPVESIQAWDVLLGELP